MAMAETLALKAFPALSRDHIALLHDRFVENGFSDNRAMDAVKFVIDHCKYPVPSIADFIQFDKTTKTYSWNEIEHLHNEGKLNKSDYGLIKIDGKIRYALNDEIELFKLIRHIPEDRLATFQPPPVDMTKFKGMTVEEMITYAAEKANR
jgi:hypothetical protein